VAATDERWRGALSTLIAVVVALALSLGLTTGWADYAFADSDEFARRSVAVLDSAAVRREVSDAVTDRLIQTTAELISFRSVLNAVVEDVIDTDAFRHLFQAAVREAHQALLTRGGQQMLVDLSEAVAIVATTLQIINPSVAARLSPDTANLVMDVSNRIQAMQLWKIGNALREIAVVSLLVALAGLIAIVVISPRRHLAAVTIGLALIGAGIVVVGVTFAVPTFAARPFTDPTVATAIGGAVFRFVGDLRTLGLWVVGYGVVAVTLGSLAAPQDEPVRLRSLLSRGQRVVEGWTPGTDGGRFVRGLALVGVAALLLMFRDAVVPMAVALLAAYVGYLGLFQLLQVIAPARSSARQGVGVERRVGRITTTRGLIAMGVLCGILLVMTGGFAVATLAARRDAAAAAEVQCNGSTELCDRPLDQVAFAASHNSMSAADDPGWLFAENLTGIPDQLEFGIRTFLVKSHYGRSTGVSIAGAEVVVTDTEAEAAVRPTASRGEIGQEQFDRARQIAASVPPPTVQREVYLCHVYCELGATRFSDVLASVKHFLDRNPNEVLIFVIGDFVSIDDTNAVFEAAGLGDRRWNYDPSQSLPTLRDLIDADQSIVVMSENSSQPPGWNIGAYTELLQDTPFTFASPDDFSCEANRGRPDAAMFQINHWITTDRPPNIDQARQVNAYDVLMPRVRRCQQERGKFPNLVGVNFYQQGDLLRVVDELNGVSTDRP
jgi:hypothetical protein